MKDAYLIIAHGSRERESNEAFFHLLERFRKAYPRRLIEGAFLELAEPGIPAAIKNCVAQGAKQVFILPLMMFPGRHVKQDIPRLIQDARAEYPDLDFHYAGPLCDHPGFVDFLEEKVKALA